jgi:hypothetical protein
MVRHFKAQGRAAHSEGGALHPDDCHGRTAGDVANTRTLKGCHDQAFRGLATPITPSVPIMTAVHFA